MNFLKIFASINNVHKYICIALTKDIIYYVINDFMKARWRVIV